MERKGIFATAKLKKVLLNFVSTAGSQGWDNIHFSLPVVLCCVFIKLSQILVISRVCPGLI